MKICKVVGKVQATVKHPSLEGERLLAVRELDGSGSAIGTLSIAVDAAGAGTGDIVAVATGGAAARALPGGSSAADAAIVAILDLIVVDGKEIFSRREEK